MTRIRLHNDDWGYETNCFVCEPRNERGLRIPFFHDTELGAVVADWELSDAHSGAPSLVHGGVVLAVLDEAMAWACIAIGHRWAVTTETTTRFERPVRVGRRHRVEAQVVSHQGTAMSCHARVLDRDDRECAAARATFTTLGEAQATRLARAEIDDAHRDYLHD